MEKLTFAIIAIIVACVLAFIANSAAEYFYKKINHNTQSLPVNNDSNHIVETEKIGTVSIKYIFHDLDKIIEVITNKPILSKAVFNTVLSYDYVVGCSGAGDIYHLDTPNDRHILTVKYINNRDSLTMQLKRLISQESLFFNK